MGIGDKDDFFHWKQLFAANLRTFDNGLHVYSLLVHSDVTLSGVKGLITVFHCPAQIFGLLTKRIALLLHLIFIVNRYFTEIAFLGTDFFGWQTQPNETNIQDTITASLKQILQKPSLNIVGCGRTDTGVHASQYYFHFDCDIPLKDIKKLVYKLNRMLPASIAVKRILEVNENLHARFDAISRTYQYHINHKKDPFLSLISWQHNRSLNIDKMNEAASLLLQYSDFSAFSKTGGDNRTSLCKISQANWQKKEDRLLFTITADRFLRNMVRAIVGTLIEVGLGNIELADFKKIIESQSRSKAGASVPAKGLFLTAVKYKDLND